MLLPLFFCRIKVLQTNNEYGARAFLNGEASPNELVKITANSGQCAQCQHNNDNLFDLSLFTAPPSSKSVTAEFPSLARSISSHPTAETALSASLFLSSHRSHFSPNVANYEVNADDNGNWKVMLNPASSKEDCTSQCAPESHAPEPQARR